MKLFSLLLNLIRRSCLHNVGGKSDAYRKALDNGNRALDLGNHFEACRFYRSATDIDPASADGWLRLGYALKERGDISGARAALHNCLSRDDKNADAHLFIGLIAVTEQRFEDAAASLKKALELAPNIEVAYGEAALSLFKNSDPVGGLKLITAGIERYPTNSDFYFLQGNLYAELGKFHSACTAYQAALLLAPDRPEILANLGNCERHIGRTTEALAHIRKALQAVPLQATWRSNLLFTLQYAGTLSRQALFDEHLRFARDFEEPYRSTWPSINEWRPYSQDRRIKIGYVSGDLRQHSLAFFLEPVLRCHDRQHVEVYCYYTFALKDRVTERLKELTEHWRDCDDRSDEELLRDIRTDQIDVLIDLSGHTGHNRLPVFAKKAAPVQITWLGYQATTGLTAMDYRITDASMDPPGLNERFHSETLIRLSAGAVFQPSPDSPDVGPLPATTTDVFTFACLNNPAKITPPYARAVAEILNRTSGTRFLLGNATPGTANALSKLFTDQGAPAGRITLLEKKDFIDYLKAHQQIDLALDTFPYNGGTTTLHSLWMGVPVLALDGDSSISRVGAQTMRGLGMGTFVCEDIAAYIQRGIELATEINLMQSVRQNLRPHMKAVVVSSAKAFTAELESACMQARLKVTAKSAT